MYVCMYVYAVMTMHQGRSDMSAGNEDKNPSPVESQFFCNFEKKRVLMILFGCFTGYSL